MQTQHIIDFLDSAYIIEALRNKVPRSEIYKREYTRLRAEGVTQHWTEGVIANFARRYKSGRLYRPENEISEIPTYIYDVEPPIPGGLPRFTGRETLTGNWGVISDLHCPYMSLEWFHKAVQTFREYGIRQVLVAGDIADGTSASSWPKDLPDYPQELERQQLREVTTALTDWFDMVVYLPGNHDRRYIKKSNGILSFYGVVADFIQYMPDNLVITEYDRVNIVSGPSDWVVSHQVNYGKKSGAVAQQLINKFRANVIIPHQHYSGLHLDEYGHNQVGIEIGGLMDPTLIPYANLKTSTSRPMRNGFAMIIKGTGYLYADLNANVIQV